MLLILTLAGSDTVSCGSLLFYRECLLDHSQTVAAITAFILALVLYPEVQRRAQEELDRVIGTSRLPTFDDRPTLPYIECIVKETLRYV